MGSKATPFSKRFNSTPVIAVILILLFTSFMCYLSIEQFDERVNVPSEAKDTVKKDDKHLKALHQSSKYTAGKLVGADPDANVKVISTLQFDSLIQTAKAHPRKRKMNDLTKNPEGNSLQVLVNTWTDGSYSPVHRHNDYSEAFVVLKGALAFWTWDENDEKGRNPQCHILSDISSPSPSSSASLVNGKSHNLSIIVEKGIWHAMTAAPSELGYPGYAVIYENSGHLYEKDKPTKVLAPFAPVFGDGFNGDPKYFSYLLSLCPSAAKS